MRKQEEIRGQVARGRRDTREHMMQLLRRAWNLC